MKKIDQIKQEVAWEQELKEHINQQKAERIKLLKERKLAGSNIGDKPKQRTVGDAWGDAQKVREQGVKNFGGKKSEMTSGLKVAAKPWGLLKQMGKSGDGIYFMVFVLSVTADILTFITGSIGAVPVAGWLFDFIASGGVFLIKIFFMTVIMTLYFLVGHYKNTHRAKRVIYRIAVTMGFDFMELIPVVAVLPFFITSFLINYGMVLYARALEEEEKKALGEKGGVESGVYKSSVSLF